MSQQARITFTMLDKILNHFDRPAEPETIQLELAVPGSLDTDKLLDAARVAAARHPMASVRRVQARTPTWEVCDRLGLDPVSATDESIDDVRDSFFSTPIPLETSPPFRVLHVRASGGDRFLLSVNHSALDGMGTVRLARSITRAYAGEDDPVPDVDPLAVRDGSTLKGTTVGHTTADKLKNLARMSKAKDSLAIDGGSAQADGYGFHVRRLDAPQTNALRSRSDVDATANDVLVTAGHLAGHRWNVEHGAPTSRLTVTMPVNLRHADWWEEVVANFSSQFVTDSAPPRSDPERVLREVIEQTSHAKATRSVWGIYDLPAALRHGIPASLKMSEKTAGDTIVLSNLGRAGDPITFGPGLESRELLFTPPCFAPMGIAIGVGFAGDPDASTATLTFRRRRSMFDAAAGDRFADLYLACLDEVTAGADA